MEQAAKAIASSEVGGRTELSGGDGTRRLGWAKFEGALGPVLVVVAHVDAQYVFELVAREDQHSVEAFAAHGSDPAFGDGVRVGGPCRCADDRDAVSTKDRIEARGELGCRGLGSGTGTGGRDRPESCTRCGLVG